MTLIFIGMIFGVSKMIDVQKVKENWPKYRCRPDVMLSAPIYGHDATNNLQFCLKNIFDGYSGGAMAPLFSFMGMFAQILVTLLSSINSIRMTFATLIGSFTKVFSEFSSRFKSLFYTIQTSAFRIKFLMGRIFAMMNSIMFMGMSGIKAADNLGNTPLFKFLNIMCFDPDTPVSIEGRGRIAIKDVKMGDIFQGTNDRVTCLFRILGDGQEMCYLRGCTVSINHYLLYMGKWIHAGEHPEAIHIGEWYGGTQRPLICFNTSTHQFPVNGFIFRDYDESDEGDIDTMNYVLKCVNSSNDTTQLKGGEYIRSCHPDTKILQKDGSIAPAKDISLGTRLSHGEVLGVIRKECTTCCWIDGEAYGSGTLLWRANEKKWRRAGDISPIVPCEPTIFISYIISPGACIETAQGTMFRDYVEIHHPEIEDAYTVVLRGTEVNESHMVQTEC